MPYQMAASIVTINHTGAKVNRKNCLEGMITKSGYDWDEWPKAVFKEDGKGAALGIDLVIIVSLSQVSEILC